jgi:FlaA1/EpsC-like NDP-sugar epimerase
MSIGEAAQLIIHAESIAEGGEVYVLDMGEPVKIIDLAKKLIELSGHTLRDKSNPNGDIKIKITGLRPGEKLYEELLIEDNAQPTSIKKIFKANENFIRFEDLEKKLITLTKALEKNSTKEIKKILKVLVREYKPDQRNFNLLDIK